MAKRYSDEALLQSVRMMASSLGHSPTIKEYEISPYKIVYYKTFIKRFHGFCNGLYKAGIIQKNNLHQRNYKYTDEEIFNKIYHMTIRDKKYPSYEAIGKDEEYRISDGVLYNRFGNSDQLYTIMTEKYPDIKRYPRYMHIQRYDDEQMLSELYQACIQSPETTSLHALMEKYCTADDNTYKAHFGNYDQIRKILYKKYGLKMVVTQQNDRQWLEDEVLRIYNETKIVPMVKELQEQSFYVITLFDIQKGFGGYKQLLKKVKLFGEYKKRENEYKISKEECIQKIREEYYKEKHTIRDGKISVYKLVKNAGLPLSIIKRYFKNPAGLKKETKLHMKVKTAPSLKELKDKIRQIVIHHPEDTNNLSKLAARLGYKYGSISYVRKQFGSHKEIREYINYCFKKLNATTIVKTSNGCCKSQYSKDRIIENLREIAQDIGHAPTFAEYKIHPLRICSANTAQIRFTSWHDALVAAGLSTNYTNEQIINSLTDMSKQLMHFPTINEYKKSNKKICSVTTIYKRFGTWSNVRKIMGLPQYESKRAFSDEILIQNLRDFAMDTGKTSYCKYQLYEKAIVHANTIIRSFGSWSKALEAAGLKEKSAS